MSKRNAESPDDLAKDLLRSNRLRKRMSLGERLMQRVGGRMWDRPNVAVSERLYARFQLDDPWAPPGTEKREERLTLGPVNLRFGEQRREPARHLKPKDTSPKPAAGAAAVDPVAKYRRPESPRPAPSEAAPPKPPVVAPPRPPTPPPAPDAPPAHSGPPATQPGGKYAITGSSGEFGRVEKRGLVGKLPQRPDLLPGGAPPKVSAPTPTTPTAPAPSRPAPVAAPIAAAPIKSSSRPQPTPKRTPGSGGGGGGGLPAPVPVARPPLPKAEKPRAGRFRMAPTEIRSPVVRPVEVTPAPAPPPPTLASAGGIPMDPEPIVAAEPVAAPPPPAPKPVDRSIPSGPMGLDDLFGGAAQDGGRMRFGRRRKKAEGDAEGS